MAASALTGEIGSTAWLSHGFEELLHGRAFDYDVIIVGSGYGGAVAAAELAGCTEGGREITVCVLERGREYLSGMFPSRLAELPGHVRFSTDGSAAPRGRREGLFDIRVGPDISALVANGLGGGSLINAGVMALPHQSALQGWPGGIRDELFAPRGYFERAKARLAVHPGIDGHPGGHPKGRTAKLDAFQRLDPAVRPAPMSIGMRETRNADGVIVGECKRCGDCATGCNHGAKNSLDVNLLAAAEAAGAKIFTGATVLRIERDGGAGWLLHAVHTDEQLRKREGGAARLRARRLILAAGTFGSTEILLRSQGETLRFSPLLGQRFSANGDAIAALYDQGDPVNAVANEADDPDGEGRGVGPTITGILDLRDAATGEGPVIEEIAIPGALRRVFEETVTTAKALHALADPDDTRHGDDAAAHDPCAVNAAEIARTSIFVMMGDDGAKGALELVAGADEAAGDGAIRVRWPALRHGKLFERQIEELQRRAGAGAKKALVLPNPLWRLLPSKMAFLLDDRRGPLVTVHPLGGCSMGATAYDGVVNHIGQVFDPAGDSSGASVWPDLVVLDGSIVRNALGINPALTITALALRAVEALRGRWGLKPADKPKVPRGARPRFRILPKPAAGSATEVELVERMTGEATLEGKGGAGVACVVELTLQFARRDLAALVLPAGGTTVPMKRELRVQSGQARVFLKERWDAWSRRGGSEDELAGIAEIVAPLDGGLSFLHREPSTAAERVRRAYKAYRCNRGLRDAWQEVVSRWRKGTLWSTRRELWARKADARDLASRAGEARLLEYRLAIGPAQLRNGDTPIDASRFREGMPVSGSKRLTYELRCNPWRQLMEMKLAAFPGLRGNALLGLDLNFLARERVPLVRIVAQEDQVSALADVGSFLAYLARLLINIHVWSFRRPDAPLPREPQRLPGRIRGLPEPQIREIELDRLPGGTPVLVRLTRYRPRRVHGCPVVMIHGYSASGTTFAHPALEPGMAQYFCARGRDVWILDLRTSSGMPTARHPWTFEDAALADLPAAFDAICRETGSPQLDIFAHCMGSAMLGMAVLAPPQPGEPFFRERDALPQRIRRAVLSQIAPVVVMSPANTFRAYALGYLRHFLPFAGYEFRVRPDAGLMDQLIDRLLATLPYPEEEFAVENPLLPWRKTPWVGTRHRMDALYGRDFSLADKRGRALLSKPVLEHIDDLFGPLSIDTVSQAIHFARSQFVTNRAGRNRYALPANIERRWVFPTLSIHGGDNGLADVATLARFQAFFRDRMGRDIQAQEFPGFGHQDSLIGKDAGQVFQRVFDFLEAP